MKASLLLCMLLVIAVNPVVAKKKKKGKVHHDPAADEAWLAKKSKEEGVVTLESGLMYKVLKSGKAWAKSPTKVGRCSVNYVGTLTPPSGGTQFDAGQLTVAPTGVIPAWTEALQLMREGDVWELYVPTRLGYGAGGQAKIPPNAALVFRLELLKVQTTMGASVREFKRFEPLPVDPPVPGKPKPKPSSKKSEL